MKFSLRISSVNCGFGHIYWINPSWKTWFFVQGLFFSLYFLKNAGSCCGSESRFDKEIRVPFLLVYKFWFGFHGNQVGTNILSFLGVALWVLYGQFIDHHLKYYAGQGHQVGIRAYNQVCLAKSSRHWSDILVLMTQSSIHIWLALPLIDQSSHF